jgi:hypothetical protein
MWIQGTHPADLSVLIPLALNPNGGNVGIGTTSPGNKLSILNGVSGSFVQLGSTIADVANTEVGRISGNTYSVDDPAKSLAEIDLLTGTHGYLGAISFRTNGSDSTVFRATERMRITESGNVGIGTTAPGVNLDVEGNSGGPATSGTTQTGVFRIGTGSVGNSIDFGQISAGPYSMWIQGTHPADLSVLIPLALNPNGGKVGIGTTNPGAMLQVGAGNTDVTTDVMRINTANANVNALTISNWIGSSTTYGPRINFDNSTIGQFYIGQSDGANNFDIATTWGTPLMRIQGSSGNVGIGTTAPTQGILQLGNGSAYTSLAINGSTGASGGSIVYFNSNGASVAWVGTNNYMQGDASSDFGIQSYTGKALKFYTNNSTTPSMVLGASSPGSVTIANASGTQKAPCLADGTGGGVCGTSTPAFSAITSATNTTASMVVGTGGSLGVSGSGTISANVLAGNRVTNTSVASLGTGSLVPGSCINGGASAVTGTTASSVVTASLSATAAVMLAAPAQGIVVTALLSTDTHVPSFYVCDTTLTSWTYTGYSVAMQVH